MDELIVHELPDYFSEVEIYPLADLHIGDPVTDIPLFKKFIEYILAEPNRFLVYNGDNANNAIKSSISNVYNETMSPNKQKKFLIRELEPVKDRFLCFVPGNHEERSAREVDNNIVEDIAYILGLEHLFRENEAFLKITLGKKKNGKRVAYSVQCVHGVGGGRKPGSALNRAEEASKNVENLDIFIMSHVHKKIGHRYQTRIIDMHNNKVIFREKLIVVSSSWQDYSGYAARKLLTPGAKGATKIILSGTEKYAKVEI